MDDVERAARIEARRRYSAPGQNALAAQIGFEDGAEWQANRDAEQPATAVTDEMVERAVRIYNAARGERFHDGRVQMRAALEAALSAKGGEATTSRGLCAHGWPVGMACSECLAGLDA